MHNEYIMKYLISRAKISTSDSYPIQACVVKGDSIISIASTSIRKLCDPTAHAEILAIREACKKLGSPYIPGCWLFSTLEPCPMCTSAAIWAKMDGIIYGAAQEDAIANYELTGNFRQINLKCRDVVACGEPKLELIEDLLREECCRLFDLISPSV